MNNPGLCFPVVGSLNVLSLGLVLRWVAMDGFVLDLSLVASWA